jgi:excisionase family DNA binding protein
MHSPISPIDPIAVSIKAAGDALGIKKTATYQLINEGRLETIRLGRRHLVLAASILALANRAAA